AQQWPEYALGDLRQYGGGQESARRGHPLQHSVMGVEQRAGDLFTERPQLVGWQFGEKRQFVSGAVQQPSDFQCLGVCLELVQCPSPTAFRTAPRSGAGTYRSDSSPAVARAAAWARLALRRVSASVCRWSSGSASMLAGGREPSISARLSLIPRILPKSRGCWGALEAASHSPSQPGWSDQEHSSRVLWNSRSAPLIGSMKARVLASSWSGARKSPGVRCPGVG